MAIYLGKESLGLLAGKSGDRMKLGLGQAKKQTPAVAPRAGEKPGDKKTSAAKASPAASDLNVPPRLQDQAFATSLIANAYTRERATFLMRTIVVLGVCLSASVSLNLVLATKPQEFRYIWTDAEGRLREITLLNEPSLSDVEVANWVAQAISEAYSMDFANFRAQQLNAQKNFTPAGWREFQAALERSNTLQSVRANNYVLTAVPTGAPVIEKRGVISGRFAWLLRFPITVTFQSSQQKQSASYTLEVLVVRMAPNEHPRGIGIASVNYL